MQSRDEIFSKLELGDVAVISGADGTRYIAKISGLKASNLGNRFGNLQRCVTQMIDAIHHAMRSQGASRADREAFEQEYSRVTGAPASDGDFDATRDRDPGPAAGSMADMTEPQLRDLMDGVGSSIEYAAKGRGIAKPLFVALLFNDPAVAQYVSNCNRADMVKALREAADRVERGEDLPRE